MRRTLMVFAILMASASMVHAQTPVEKARARRRAEVARRNYSQSEALRLLFGPQGLPALTRPADPWNLYQTPGRRMPIVRRY